MGERDFAILARNAVSDWYKSKMPNVKSVEAYEVYIVWMCKILQNNKALLSTNVSDGLYFEFTWNGDKNEGYLDVYKRIENQVVTNE